MCGVVLAHATRDKALETQPGRAWAHRPREKMATGVSVLRPAQENGARDPRRRG